MCTFCWRARHMPRLSSRYSSTRFPHFFSRKSFTNTTGGTILKTTEAWTRRTLCINESERTLETVSDSSGVSGDCLSCNRRYGLRLLLSKQRLSHELYVYIWPSSQKHAVFTQRRLLESLVMWHCNNPLKLSISSSSELVTDSCWMSITSWVHSVKVSYMRSYVGKQRRKRKPDANLRLTPTARGIYTLTALTHCLRGLFLSWMISTGNPTVTPRPYFLLLI